MIKGSDERPFWIRFLTALGIGLALSLLYLLLNGFFIQEDIQVWLRGVSDAFLLPGVIFLLISGLGWVSSKGFFDLMGFATSSFFTLIFHGNQRQEDRPKDFFAYKMEKDNKGRYWLPHLLLAALVLIALSILFALLHQG